MADTWPTYPSYAGNTQNTANDIPGRTDIANAADYNVHDREILLHQTLLISHDGNINILVSRVNQDVRTTASPTFVGATFGSLPVVPSGFPTLATQVSNKAYVDNMATSGVSADHVSYAGETYTNVSDALDHLLYESPTVTMTGGSSNEKGATVTDVALVWTCNKTMTTRSLSDPVPAGDQDRGSGGSGTYTHSGANLTTNTTYTITVGDGTNTTTATTSVLFYSKRYWGVSTIADPSDAEILSELSSENASSRSTTKNGIAPTAQYIHFCWPASWGTGTFTVNGLLNTDWQLTTRNLTNASGYTVSYYLYRSTNILTGTYNIVVS